MKWVILTAVSMLAFWSVSAHAQEGPDIVSEPICFLVVNEAPYTVYGSFITDLYDQADGTKARHRSNFRLEQTGSIDETEGFPLDKAEFCTYGPFFPGRKLEMTLRTLVPIFTCQTRVDQGAIVIKGEKKPEGGTNTWADCYE